MGQPNRKVRCKKKEAYEEPTITVVDLNTEDGVWTICASIPLCCRTYPSVIPG